MARNGQSSAFLPPSDGAGVVDAEEMVGLSGIGPLTSAPDPEAGEDTPLSVPIPSASKKKKTRLHEVIDEFWKNINPEYLEIMKELAFRELIQYADPDSAKMTKNGFELKLHTGSTMRFDVVQQKSGAVRETITGSKENFQQQDADAMVALARLRGMNSVSLHGSAEQKEMIWLAVQQRNLFEKANFERRQQNGEIPETQEDGTPIVFTPLVVDNYAPAPDSKAVLQMQQLEAEIKAAIAAQTHKEVLPEEQPAPPMEAVVPLAEEAKEKPLPVSEEKTVVPEAAPKKEAAHAFKESDHPRGYHGHFAKKDTPPAVSASSKKDFAAAAAPKNLAIKKAPAHKAAAKRHHPKYTKKNPHPSHHKGPKHR